MQERILKKLAEILDVEAVALNTRLCDMVSWDSLGKLSVIAFLDAEYEIVTQLDDVAQFKTGNDILLFAANHVEK